MFDKIPLSSSMEDYLEAILVIETKNRVARVSDIASYLEVQMPSVTGAVKSLKEKGLVKNEKNSFIYLTDRGKKIAEGILNRHAILVKFLEEILYIPHEKSEEQACKIEHVIDSDTATRLENCTKFLAQKLVNGGFINKNEWEKEITK